MEFRLSSEQLSEIERHCLDGYPEEACGILIGKVDTDHKILVEILPTTNGREEERRHNRYMIPPQALLEGEMRAEELELDVIGYFHSHPDHPAKPSIFDRDHAWPWYSYMISSVQEGRSVLTRSWNLRQDRSAFEEEPIIVKSRTPGPASKSAPE